MKNKILAALSLLIILAFIGYIIYDSARPVSYIEEETATDTANKPADQWMISMEIFISEGLKAVAADEDGFIFAGGDSFIKCFSSDMKEQWNLDIPEKIRALSFSGDVLYAVSEELIFLISRDGRVTGEWGPYEAGCLFTSISANKDYVAVADAGNKTVFIFRKDGEVISMIGHFGETLLIPSPYFDVYLTEDNILYMAHTGSFRIEKRTIEGKMTAYYGESGNAPEEFCGCCNPAHFTVVPQGFLTAEKGINRIKILGPEGGFSEFVSSDNDFIASVPLDVASADGKTIYGANPADGKMYVFVRK